MLPWNFPLLMLAWKIGPALAAGCSVIVKPAEQTSLTTLRVAELAIEAGIPAGVFNVVTGTGKDVGEPIGLHMDVAMVSFTGSTATGRRFLRYAADSNLKRVVLECGGKNPAVVLEDAEDLDLVAEQVVNGAFWNMGENCSATSRLIVQASVKDELMRAHRRLHARVEDGRPARSGEPRRRARQHGALRQGEVLSRRGRRRPRLRRRNAKGHLHRADRHRRRRAATAACSRRRSSARSSRSRPSRLWREAVALANDTPYGLAASVYTGSLRNAIKLSREIRAGVVTVNCFGEGDVTTPFGGYKESGFGGRDKSIFAHDQYTELKTIWIDVSDRSVDETVR